jgi:hypothetical protein
VRTVLPDLYVLDTDVLAHEHQLFVAVKPLRAGRIVGHVTTGGIVYDLAPDLVPEAEHAGAANLTVVTVTEYADHAAAALEKWSGGSQTRAECQAAGTWNAERIGRDNGAILLHMREPISHA